MAALVLTAPSASAAVLDREIATLAENLAGKLVDTRRDIHANPELANREYRTGKLVAARLRELGLEVRHPVANTGVVGVLRGGKSGRVVAVRADMDALPIDERREVAYRSRNTGVMHACGHDAHTSIVLGVAEVLARLRERLPGTVVFLFQPAEEGAPPGEDGGAELMIREGVLDGPRVEAIFGLHVDPQLEAGRVGWTAGAVFASRDRFRIEIVGKRTHGAYPHTGVDPVPVAAQVILALQGLVAGQSDAQRPKVLTIGRVEGGEHANILAEHVQMDGLLRSLDEATRRDLKERMARVVERFADAHGAEGRLDFAGPGVPALSNDGSLVRRLLPALTGGLGQDAVVEVEAQMGSEDFALYAQRVPAFYLKLGVRNEARSIVSGVHTDSFDVDESAFPLGVRALCSLVWAALQ